MPMLGGRYIDQDEYDDLRADAREEEYYDQLYSEGWTCEDCGEMWLPGKHPATRLEPAYVDKDTCPKCGSGPVTDDWGYAQEGKTE